MAAPSPLAGTIRFGEYELDTRLGELRKSGLRLRLQGQPLQVLEALVERPGDLVTREELRQRLWPDDTFVDFDHSLNNAVARIRETLSDSVEQPRYIQTLPRRGYRFVAPVEGPPVRLLSIAPPQPPPEEEQGESQPANATELSSSGVAEHGFRYRWAALAVAVLIAGAALWWQGSRLSRGATQPTTYTIAVLPFKNLSAESDSDYFSDGLTDEIIRNLSIVDGLEVKSQTSSFYFKNKPRNIREVGAQLGVNLVMEGSVLRSADRLRVDAQLIRIADDAPLWSGRYDRKLADVFAIQDEISRSIVNELRLKLGAGQRRYNTNLEAYDLYLRADTLATLHGQDLPKSIELFQTVIAKDSNFAPAYAGLVIAYADLTVRSNDLLPDVAYPKMRAAAEKALQLDPLLAEAHEAMGLVHSRDRRWADAEREFRRSLELNPKSSRSHADFALWVLVPMGKMPQAVQELRTAVKLDPLSTSVLATLTWVLVTDRQYDEVIADCRNLSLDLNDAYSKHIFQVCGRALAQHGKLAEAIAIFERLGANQGPGFLGYAYAKAGRREDALKLVSQYRDRPGQLAFLYAGLGDKEGAIQGLQQMADLHDPRFDIYLLAPEFDLFRDDARFKQFGQQQREPRVR